MLPQDTGDAKNAVTDSLPITWSFASQHNRWSQQPQTRTDRSLFIVNFVKLAFPDLTGF